MSLAINKHDAIYSSYTEKKQTLLSWKVAIKSIANFKVNKWSTYYELDSYNILVQLVLGIEY